MNIHKGKGSKFLTGLLSVLLTFSFIPVGLVNVDAATASMGTMLMPGATPDYWGNIPNYANSPLPELDAAGNVIPGTGIRKFVDSLPGLGAANANDLGQYIPVAVPDTTTYPGSDYYEIELRQYQEQMHKDLPPTTLRGYVQVNTTDPTVSKVHYLGPMIVAQKDRPVRVKFTNKLPTGPDGDLFIPVDSTIMGAGMAPDGGMFTENRATLHLHGGVTPWISDGTPNQWITPAGENTPYPKGVSVHNVPDMPDPGPGSQTFFYTNQESARLMFYHDHSYGITRLNVYAGEAAGYILRDKTEQDLIASGAIPSTEIPLILQDKTFVPKPAQLAVEDPTWNTPKWGGYGNLWFPHVYMPNQNPYDNSGANPMGRWDYGPWFWPPYTGLKHGPVANPLAGQPGQPAINPGVPNVSAVPEAFMDTPIVNGTAYPYLDVQPMPYRFRILNTSNDRFWNLQLYTAKSNSTMWDANGALLDANAGEVPMVPAVRTPGYPATWPVDGRDGGVPDPTAAGPNIVQIGTESGFLPNAVELVNQPVDYVYNRRDIVVLNVASKTLFMGPAERADVIIDFSKYAGKTLILYNDSPAPVPAFDPRYDYYTGDPDQTANGGAPSTLPGYGPNTRTVMQIKVAPAAAGTTAPGYPVASVNSIATGAGYTAPTASIQGGGGTGATATATGEVDALAITNPGAGYTAAPTVTIDPPVGGQGTAATATATIDSTGAVTGITLVTPGSGYTTAPNVTLSGTATTSATASATIKVTGFTLTNSGSGYTSNPTLTILDSAGGLGTGATGTVAINSFTSQISALLPKAYTDSQHPLIVPPDVFARIQDTKLTFAPVGTTTPITFDLQPKAIQELFEVEYGRMNATMGMELPNTNVSIQTTIPYGYVDPVTEIVKQYTNPTTPSTTDGTQLWKVTHNGVDTHVIHFHLFDVQLINRVGWDGAIRPPDPNEMGVKDTLKMNPLEDCIIALRPIMPKTNFGQPDSIRALDTTMPIGATGEFMNIDPATNNPITVTNQLYNFGAEYMWHCHILGHEENDMMRPIAVMVPHVRPTASVLSYTRTGKPVNLSWTDATPITNPTTLGNPANEIGFKIERAVIAKNGKIGTYVQIAQALANQTSFIDTTADLVSRYSYRVTAFNSTGSAFSNTVRVGP